MQDYVDLAAKNGVTLLDKGACQCCGANTTRGIHQCLEIFKLGFQNFGFSNREDHKYRFLIVDAHALQHPEIHGRWSNHFHLSRLHLIFKYEVKWTYVLSPLLSDSLNKYKANRQDEYLIPPEIGRRGNITTTDILQHSDNESACKKIVQEWALEVYRTWNDQLSVVDEIGRMFLHRK